MNPIAADEACSALRSLRARARVEPSRALLVAALALGGCTSSVARRARFCLEHNSSAPLAQCTPEVARWLTSDRDRAASELRAIFAARERRCRRLTPASVVSVEESQSCLEIALLRLGAYTPAWRDNAGSGEALDAVLSRASGEILFEDVAFARAIAGALCPAPLPSLACAMKRVLDEHRLPRQPEPWITQRLAISVAQRLTADPSATFAQLDDAHALLEALDGQRARGRHRPRALEAESATSVRAALRARMSELAGPLLQREVAALTERPRTAAGLADTIADSVRLRALLDRSSPAAHRAATATLCARARRQIIDVIEEQLERHQFDDALTWVNRTSTPPITAAFDEARSYVSARAAAFYRGERERHRASGRWFAAQLHGALGAPYGERAVLNEARQAFAALARPALVVSDVAASCPWVSAEREVNGGAAVALVSVRWTRCESDEQRTRGVESYAYQRTVWSYTTRQEAYQETVVSAAAPSYSTQQMCSNHFATGYRCWSLPSAGGGGSSQSSTSTVTRYRTVRVPVERLVTETGRREVTRRTLRTAASAMLDVTFGALGTVVSFAPEALLVHEEAYQSPHGSRAFSTTTLESQRQAIAQRWRALLATDGAVHRAIAQAAAVDANGRAVRLAAIDRDAAEEAFARAMVLGVVSAEATEFYRQRYGVGARSLRDAVERARAALSR